MLKAKKIASSSVLSGQEAIKIVEKRIQQVNDGESGASMFKLILLDYKMPDMNGPQVAI